MAFFETRKEGDSALYSLSWAMGWEENGLGEKGLAALFGFSHRMGIPPNTWFWSGREVTIHFNAPVMPPPLSGAFPPHSWVHW